MFVDPALAKTQSSPTSLVVINEEKFNAAVHILTPSRRSTPRVKHVAVKGVGIKGKESDRKGKRKIVEEDKRGRNKRAIN